MTKHKQIKMSEAQLAALIDEARQSGRSLAAQAQAHGLSPKRLYMARWRMRKRSAVAATSVQSHSKSAFIPVAVHGQCSLRLRARLVNGVQIECDADDPASLQWCLTQLASLPCSI